MKIGLLTYHHSMNYGAVLQTYATCRALAELGHNVEIIDFRQPEKKSNWSLPFFYKVKHFERFKKQHYAPYSMHIESLDKLQEMNFDYDCILVGSDQTWNPNISRDKRMAYFLTFGNEKMKRVSYASSLGVSSWPEKYKEDIPMIKDALSRFDAISVREYTGKKLLEETFGIKSTVVLDPTLLFSDYSELTGAIQNKEDVICCLLHRHPKQMKQIRDLNSFLGKKGKSISTIKPVRGLSYIYPPSIESWLKYIASAQFVITDSFHGVAFSLIFQKEFVVITPNLGKNSRLKDLMDMLGLSYRYHLEDEVINFSSLINTKIHYDKVNDILQKERNNSWNFLKNNIG